MLQSFSAASSMVLLVPGILQDPFLRVHQRLHVLARRKETSLAGQEGAAPSTGLELELWKTQTPSLEVLPFVPCPA